MKQSKTDEAKHKCICIAVAVTLVIVVLNIFSLLFLETCRKTCIAMVNATCYFYGE